MTAAAKTRIRWRLPVIIGASALLLSFVLFAIDGDLGMDTGMVLALLVFFTLVVLLIYTAARGEWTAALITLATVVVYLFSLWMLPTVSASLRGERRWLMHRETLKAAVQSDPAPSRIALTHVELDSWGARDDHNEMQLVFSPDDELRNYSPSHLVGLPCPVYKVRRLERQWYAVTFYTGMGWYRCQVP